MNILKSGFTLIELLFVVLIIGILAAIAVPQYQKAVEKSRAAEAVSNIKSIANASEIYFFANGEYPMDFSNLDIEFGKNCSGENCTHGQYFYRFSTTPKARLSLM